MILDIVRSLFLALDSVIYGFIPTVYDFIMVLARVHIFNQQILKTFANNIYTILGIFMLFRLSFSLLIYIVNPDQLFDEKKGVGKIAVRAVTALVLIVAIPFAFQYADDLQKVVINNGIVSKIIIGNADEAMVGEGTRLSSETLKAFIVCDYCNPDQQNTLNDALNDPKDFGPMTGILNERSSENADSYVYGYTFILSTAAGLFVLVMLIIYCFDIALRTVKLGFLQLLTPVAVVSYVDPKSSEDGFFSKWLKMSLSVYLSLFIRLCAIAFMVFIIHQLPTIKDNILSTPSDYGITVTDESGVVTPTGYNDNSTLDVKPLIITGANSITSNIDVVDFNSNYSVPEVKPVSVNLKTQSEMLVLATFIEIFIIIGVLMFVKELPKVLEGLFGLSSDSMGSFKNPLQRMFGGKAIGAVGGFAAGAALKGGAGLTSGAASFLKSGLSGRNPFKGFGKGFMAGQKKVPLKGGIGKQLGGAALSPFVGLGTKRPDLSSITAANRQRKAGEGYDKKYGKYEGKPIAQRIADKDFSGSGFNKGFTKALAYRTDAKDKLKTANNSLEFAEAALNANPTGVTEQTAYVSALGAQKSAQATFDAYDGTLNQYMEERKDSRTVKKYKSMKLYRDTK